MNSNFSPGEVAVMCGIPTKAVRRAILSGDLKALRYNARVLRITDEDLKAWQVVCRLRALSKQDTTRTNGGLS